MNTLVTKMGIIRFWSEVSQYIHIIKHNPNDYLYKQSVVEKCWKYIVDPSGTDHLEHGWGVVQEGSPREGKKTLHEALLAIKCQSLEAV